MGGTPVNRSRVVLFVAILAAAFNLRIGIAAIGPIVEEIRIDVGMSSALAGTLVTIPFICMSAFSFLGAPLVRRIGEHVVVLGALFCIGVGSVLRAVAPSSAAIFLATIPIGVGIGLIGVTLPAAVKRWFPDRGGEVTGAYVASLSLGIMLVGLGLVPLTETLGGWRPSLASTALPALLAAILWMVARPTRLLGAPEDRSPAEIDEHAPANFSMKTPLLLALVFGLQAMSFAGLIAWAPLIYENAGWSSVRAGLVTTSIGAFTVIASLTFPRWSERRDRRPWVAALGLMMSVGILGIALMPVDLPWVWLTFFGIGSGGIFALLLALPLDLAADHRHVAVLSSWMLGIGYLFAGAAPILTGGLRDLSGGFVVPVATLAGAGLLSAALVFAIPKPSVRVSKR